MSNSLSLNLPLNIQQLMKALASLPIEQKKTIYKKLKADLQVNDVDVSEKEKSIVRKRKAGSKSVDFISLDVFEKQMRKEFGY